MSFSLSSLAPSPALLRERCNALFARFSRRCTPRWTAAAPPECSPWKIQAFRPADRLFPLPFPSISPIMLPEHILGGFAHGDDP